MATETKNYGFIKPDINEFYDRNIDNENLDKIDEELKRIEEAAGNLDDLDTEEKTGLVAAINELKSQIGNLTNLETEEKVSLVSSVNEIHRMVSEHLAENVQQLNKIHRHNTAQDKELAYLKLKQEASDRIENGTTFADDMKGNSFGITFNESESTNVHFDNEGMYMAEGSFEEHVVKDATVVNQAYDTSGNGGRKLVRLKNGWLVAGAFSGTWIYLYKSNDNGNTWSQLCFINDGTSNGTSFSIVAKGTDVYVLYTEPTTFRTSFVKVDVLIGTVSAKQSIDTGQSAMGTCSLAINSAGTELHAAWASKNSSYPNSFNIRYTKGIISEIDGSVSWGAVEQVTTYNNSVANMGQPVMLFTDKPTIIYRQDASNQRIYCQIRNESGWLTTDSHRGHLIYGVEPYAQSNPSAIFVPPEINGLPQGRIWVAWHGLDAPDSSISNIRVSYSDDGGVNWSAMEKLTIGNAYSQRYTTITANKNNEIFVLWGGNDSANITQIHGIKNVDGVWGERYKLTNRTSGNPLLHPSALADTSIDFSSPLFIYQNGSSVNFYGTWTEGSETPTTAGTTIYELPSTDYVGAFVQKAGNVEIEAYVNDVQMDSDLENDEYMFTKKLDSEAPIKLRLELSRADTSGGNNDKVTRILGGIA